MAIHLKLYTGVLILSKGKIADRIPIFFKVFYIVSHTPILPFERIKTSVDKIIESFQKYSYHKSVRNILIHFIVYRRLSTYNKLKFVIYIINLIKMRVFCF